jgi:predicted nucleotidyltransferase
MRAEPDLDVARRFVEDSEIPGRLVLGGITGSHHYGFPSPDSDLDIKTIHLAPTDSLLGLTAPNEAYERLEVFEGVESALTSNEARQALNLLLRGNGNMLERILCPYQLIQSPEVQALQALAQGAISKRFYGHYSGFFRAMCKDFEKAERPTAKQVLYAYRVAATGIHLLTSGKLEADLSVLAEECGVPEALPLIETKRQTAEQVALDPSDENSHRASLERLGKALEVALTSSSLPEEPANRDQCESWLVQMRKGELRRQ